MTDYEISIIDGDDSRETSGIQKSTLIGYFSIKNGTYCSDASQLKYVYHKFKIDTRVRLNLNHNSHNTIVKEDVIKNWDKLNNMFAWLSLNSVQILPLDEVVFVTFRGNLTKVMCTPYENQEDWTICAKLHKGIIYLNSFETDKEIEKLKHVSKFQKRCQAWGRKFEQFLLTDDPSKERDLHKPLNENDEFNCVYKGKIGNHSLIYGAEIDGVYSDTTVNVGKLSDAYFVECKTNAILDTFKKDRNFRRYKLIKWWCQCYLVGIGKVICGFRDDDGVVREIQHYRVQDLPGMSAGLWDKNVCLNFCIRFLDFVKHIVLKSSGEVNENVFWKFDSFPGHKVRASKVTGMSKYTADFKEVNLTELSLEQAH